MVTRSARENPEGRSRGEIQRGDPEGGASKNHEGDYEGNMARKRLAMEQGMENRPRH